MISIAFNVKLVGRHNTRRGVSIAEVAISSLLIGTIMIASLNALGMVQRTWGVTANQGSGWSLGQALLGEMNATSYMDPDEPSNENLGLNAGETGSTRADFDDIDDYDDWTESPPQLKGGTVLTDFTGWTRSVDIKKVSNGNPLTERGDNFHEQGIRKITITVTSPDGEVTTLIVFRSNWGAVEQAAPYDTTVVTGVEMTMQTSSMTRSITDGISLPNHVEDTP